MGETGAIVTAYYYSVPPSWYRPFSPAQTTPFQNPHPRVATDGPYPTRRGALWRGGEKRRGEETRREETRGDERRRDEKSHEAAGGKAKQSKAKQSKGAEARAQLSTPPADGFSLSLPLSLPDEACMSMAQRRGGGVNELRQRVAPFLFRASNKTPEVKVRSEAPSN